MANLLSAFASSASLALAASTLVAPVALAAAVVDDDKQLDRAQALIRQFAVPGGLQWISPSMVGFDCANRDGIPLSGERCDELLAAIEAMGWDVDEANFGNICVQERPGSDALLKFNAGSCVANEFLANIVVDSLPFGSLSHSHLHQCLKNIASGCLASKPTTFMLNGRLSVDAVASVSLALAESVAKGLQWTVLSWKIRDVAGAMELIQAAWNRKAGVAMKESCMQAVARLAAICNSVADANKHVDFDRARQRLRMTMPESADSKEFMAVWRFCVTLGSSRAPWIEDIKQFVGLRGQNRQVKPAVFALAGQLPSTIPHIIKGLVVMAYTAPIAFFTDNFSKYLTAADTRMLVVDNPGVNPVATADAITGEGILRYFHCACVDIPASGSCCALTS